MPSYTHAVMRENYLCSRSSTIHTHLQQQPNKLKNPDRILAFRQHPKWSKFLHTAAMAMTNFVMNTQLNV